MNESETNRVIVCGSLNLYDFSQADNVVWTGGVSPTILAYNQGQIGHQVNIYVDKELQRT